MKVLFIRHGKAEALQTGILDSERHLTQEWNVNTKTDNIYKECCFLYSTGGI